MFAQSRSDHGNCLVLCENPTASISRHSQLQCSCKRQREREGRRERRDINVTADLEEAIILFKRCRFIVLGGQNHAVMAEKENKH